MVSADVGFATGQQPEALQTGDTYAPGTAITPKSLYGRVQTRKLKICCKKDKRKDAKQIKNKGK